MKRNILLRIARRIRRDIDNNFGKRASIIKSSNKVSTKLKQFGNEYGGYQLATDFISNTSELTVLSFGIGEDLSFDEELMNTYDARIYAFDPTPRTKNYVQNHVLSQNSKFHFFPYGLSDADKMQTFYFPKVKEYVSCSTHKQDSVGDASCQVEMKKFTTIIKECNISKIDILKMDIEGSEFDVMDQILSSDICISQICLEVHDYLFNDGTAYEKLSWIINLLKTNGYKLAYLSESKYEMTFVK